MEEDPYEIRQNPCFSQQTTTSHYYRPPNYYPLCQELDTTIKVIKGMSNAL